MVAQRIQKQQCYLAWDDAEVVDTLSLQPADPEQWGERPADALYLRGLAVRRSHVRKGRELLAWAERAAAGAGKAYLRLTCTATNLALRTCYERAGYHHCGDRRGNSLYEKAMTNLVVEDPRSD